MKKLNEISLDQLSMVQGGAEPVPGTELIIEDEDPPVTNTETNDSDTLLAASGSYNSSRSNVAS
jgi:hypothetical protein